MGRSTGSDYDLLRSTLRRALGAKEAQESWPLSLAHKSHTLPSLPHSKSPAPDSESAARPLRPLPSRTSWPHLFPRALGWVELGLAQDYSSLSASCLYRRLLLGKATRPGLWQRAQA